MWSISTHDFELMLCDYSYGEDNTQVNAIGQSLYVVYSKKIHMWWKNMIILLN